MYAQLHSLLFLSTSSTFPSLNPATSVKVKIYRVTTTHFKSSIRASPIPPPSAQNNHLANYTSGVCFVLLSSASPSGCFSPYISLYCFLSLSIYICLSISLSIYLSISVFLSISIYWLFHRLFVAHPKHPLPKPPIIPGSKLRPSTTREPCRTLANPPQLSTPGNFVCS